MLSCKDLPTIPAQILNHLLNFFEPHLISQPPQNNYFSQIAVPVKTSCLPKIIFGGGGEGGIRRADI